MICKWCGATVDVTKRKCPVCGREIPPLSDCGGFYDVVPEAVRAAARSEAPSQEIPRQKAVEQMPPKVGRCESQRERRNGGALLLPIACIALTVLLGAFLLLRLGAIQGQLDKVRSQTSQIGDEIQQMQAQDDVAAAQIEALQEQLATEPPTQPVQQTEPTSPLGDEELSFSVLCTDGKPDCTSDALGQRFTYRGETSENVTCLFKGEELWNAGLTYTPDVRTAELEFVFQYAVEERLVGAYQKAEFLWQYRQLGEKEWQTLKNGDDVQIEDRMSGGKSVLSVSQDWIDKKAGKEGYEVRCVLARDSTAGGSVRIAFCIRVPADLPEETTYNHNNGKNENQKTGVIA